MRRFLTSLLLLFLTLQCLAQMPVPKKPAISEGLVIDYTNTLTPDQKDRLNRKLIAYDDSTSNQIAVVIIPSLKGFPDSSLTYPIEDIALRILREWGVGGQEKKDNGIVVLVAKNDRQVRVETGYGLEGAIPDMIAASVIDDYIVPGFKAGDYYRGLDDGTNTLIQAAAGEYTAPEGYRDKNDGKGIGMGKIILILVVLFFLFGGMGKNRGGGGGMMSRRGYRGWLGPTFPGGWTGGGGGGWSGGGGGGGGFGGFGGGSGGGGGASGSW